MTSLMLPEELEYIAKTELNEVPNRVKEDIHHIRTWLSKQPHIRARTDDYSLLIFLRHSKFSLEKTKKKLKVFYGIKTTFPELFKNRDPYQKIVQYFYDQKAIAVLSHSPSGVVTVIVRLNKLHPDMISLHDCFKVFLITIDVIVRKYVNSTVAGVSLLVDIKNLPMKYISELTPQLLRKSAFCIENALPLRIKTFHVVNFPSVLVGAVNIFKSFLSTKMQKRLFIHADVPQIVEYFHPSVLPKEFGGNVRSDEIFTGEFKKVLESYREWLLEDELYRSLEDKSFLCCKLNIDLFSFDGSFRRLEID